MLRDNLVELIGPMPHSAGADPLALGIPKQRPASDDRLSCLENPRPEGAESSLTENVTSPFQAEPAQNLEHEMFGSPNDLTNTLFTVRNNSGQPISRKHNLICCINSMVGT